MVTMPLVPIQNILDGGFEGKQVDIRGWVYRKRESKDIIFVVIRDATGVMQCTIRKNSPAWAEAQKMTIESSVTLNGTVRKDERAPGGFEVSTNQLEIVGLAEPFPITKDQSEEFRRNVRHLWLRSQRMNNTMKIRSHVLNFVHEFFRRRRLH